jgi:uncharacterized membrane protein
MVRRHSAYSAHSDGVLYGENPFLVFVGSVIVTSALEFLTHLALDKIFHIILRNHSDKPFNIQSRSAFSLLFGVLGSLLIYVIQPALSKFITALPSPVAISIASALLAILLIDSANSFLNLAKIRATLDRMKGEPSQVHDKLEADARVSAVGRAKRRSA